MRMFAKFIMMTGLVVLPQLFISSKLVLAAGDASINGVVTDAAGKPVRGAMVKAALGTKTVARFTDAAGHYQISGLEPKQYDVTVDASGFALAKQKADPAQKVEINFKLTAGVDLSRLNSAEMAFLLPHTEDGDRVFLECSGCHGFETIMPRVGMPAAAWEGFLPYMTISRWGARLGFAPEQAAKTAPRIATIFGPEGVLGPNGKPDFSKIKYTPLQDAALKATITEYTVPSPGAMVHSVTVDDNSGVVWFSEYDAASNALARFDPVTETFQEFPNPLPKAQGHTGTVLKDGRFIVGLDRGSHDKDGEVATKMAMTGADGKVEALDFPGKPSGARMVIEDPTKENTVWIVIGGQTWHYNVGTKELKTYLNPVPETFPAGSYGGRFAPPGAKPTGDGYALAVDSKGTPWVTQLNLGNILHLNPATGEWKIYHTPEMASARGIDVDAEDNVWFGDYYGHKLGMLDPDTGDVKFYQPPNPYASPYGITIDRKRGYVWYGDTTANNATRFNLKTAEFVEYPLPTADAAVRFMGIDPQGRAWYGGFFNQKLGVVDPGDDTSASVSVQ